MKQQRLVTAEVCSMLAPGQTNQARFAREWTIYSRLSLSSPLYVESLPHNLPRAVIALATDLNNHRLTGMGRRPYLNFILCLLHTHIKSCIYQQHLAQGFACLSAEHSAVCGRLSAPMDRGAPCLQLTWWPLPEQRRTANRTIQSSCCHRALSQVLSIHIAFMTHYQDVSPEISWCPLL